VVVVVVVGGRVDGTGAEETGATGVVEPGVTVVVGVVAGGEGGDSSAEGALLGKGVFHNAGKVAEVPVRVCGDLVRDEDGDARQTETPIVTAMAPTSMAVVVMMRWVRRAGVVIGGSVLRGDIQGYETVRV
jgi:hypothetical protein